MTKISLLSAVLAVSSAAVQAAPVASPAVKTALPVRSAMVKPIDRSDRAQIEALERGFPAAFNARNVNKIMSYYAHEGLFVFDVTPPRQHVGWEDYRQDWRDLFAAFPGPLKTDMSDLSITVVGPVAWGHNVQWGVFTAKEGRRSASSCGSLTCTERSAIAGRSYRSTCRCRWTSPRRSRTYSPGPSETTADWRI